MPEIAANGTRLHYEVTVTAAVGVRPRHVRSWCGVVGAAGPAVERVHVCAYDRRGHGSSLDGDIPHTVPLRGDDLAALVRGLDLAPVILVGSSGGARVGLDAVLRHSGLLAGAVLSEPPVFSLDPQCWQAFMGTVVPAVQPRLDAGDLRGAVDAFFEVVCPGLWRQLDEEAKEPYLASGLMLVADLGQPPYMVRTENLSVIQLPVLAIAGTDSDPFLRSTPLVIAATVPSAALLELAHCGHVTYAEQPDAFADAVRDFANSVFAAALPV